MDQPNNSDVTSVGNASIGWLSNYLRQLQCPQKDSWNGDIYRFTYWFHCAVKFDNSPLLYSAALVCSKIGGGSPNFATNQSALKVYFANDEINNERTSHAASQVLNPFSISAVSISVQTIPVIDSIT